MDIKEALKFADDLVLAKTGKHLDNLQQAVLLASWQGKKYSQIAKEFYCTERHVGNIASKLWQILSEILNENVNKSNFRSTMARYHDCNVSNFKDVVNFGNINNFCADTLQTSKSPQHSHPTQTSNKNNTQQKLRLDLIDAPDIRTFYDRRSELTTIKTLIVQQRCRLVAVFGLSGLGKSAIARHLISQIQTQFDCIIWRSLRTSPPLEITIKNLIQFISNQSDINFPANPDTQLSMLIELLRDLRCLIILDDVQQILNSGQLAGYYKPGYENYGTLFKLIGEIPHNSCLILNSWEPPLDVLTFTEDNSAVYLLQLTGLGEAATEILKEKGLLDEEQWSELINLYQGNPLWLKLVAQTINNLFSGKVAQYLSYEPVFLSEELTLLLQQNYQRLSECEKQALTQLSNQTKIASINQVLENCQGSRADVFNAIQSLVRRGLISTNFRNNETVLTVIPIVKEYVKIVNL